MLLRNVEVDHAFNNRTPRVAVAIILLLAAPDKSKRPNAARLFANWIMGRDGNKIVNADPGNVSVYDTANLPRAYQAPGTRENRDRILRLLDSK